MRCYVAPIPRTLSKAMHRLADALTRYAPPDIEIIEDTATHPSGSAIMNPGMVLLHMIGPEGWDPYLDHFRATGTKYVCWMHCYKVSSWTPDLWPKIWKDACLVTSCYDLAADVAVAGVPFLRLPLGIDPAIFNPGGWGTAGKEYLVGTSGYVDGMEIIGEWSRVCVANGSRQFHLGPHLTLPAAVKFRNGISDELVAEYWRQCQFVSGLRRTEGFELPAFEGLACGARPVMFDREDATHWLGDHAEYVTEGTDREIREQLDQIARRPYRAVTPEEIAWVQETYTWQAMATKFWAAIPR